MKATCGLQVHFLRGEEETVYLDVSGEIALQAFPEYSANQEVWPGDDTTVTIRIDYTYYITKRGVWKLHVRLQDMDARDRQNWDYIKEAIDNLFLPGYSFEWSCIEPGQIETEEVPLDWLPCELKEKFGS